MGALWSLETFAAIESSEKRRVAASESSFLVGHDLLLRFAEAFDPQGHNVAGLQVNRRFHPQRHSRRGSGADHITGKQGHELAHVGHQIGNAEDHLRRIAFLPRHAFSLYHKSTWPRVGILT